MTKALVFDVGDVMMLSTWEVLDDLERATGRTIVGRGPYAPEGDPGWQAVLRGELGMYAYWDRKARAAGYEDGIAMFAEFPERMPNHSTERLAFNGLVSCSALSLPAKHNGW